MKKLVIILMSFFAFSVANAEQTSGKTFSAEFNKLKSLAGDWVGKKGKGDKSMLIKVNYKISSAGSSVIETLFKGSPQEMVSVYTNANEGINMTHYCALQNQPTLELQGSTKDTLEFNYTKGTNLNAEKDAYMHHLTLKLKNKNTIEQHWTQYKDGKPAGTNVFELSRVN